MSKVVSYHEKHNKLSFYDWFAAREALEGEEPSANFIKNYVHNAWSAYSTLDPVHEGDCTSAPFSCNLCVLEDLLREYRMYFFDQFENNEEVFRPIMKL